MALVKERTRTEEVRKKLCGVRYLVQDKGRGVMLQPGFIGGLKWLGKQRLVFDLGVDARQGGLWQLREAAEMMGRVYEDVEDERDRVVIVISMLPLDIVYLILTSNLPRPSLQTESPSPVYITRICNNSSRFPGVEGLCHSHGTLSYNLHETVRRVL